MEGRVTKVVARLDEFIEKQNAMAATLSTILMTVKDLTTELRQHRREQSPSTVVDRNPPPPPSQPKATPPPVPAVIPKPPSAVLPPRPAVPEPPSATLPPLPAAPLPKQLAISTLPKPTLPPMPTTTPIVPDDIHSIPSGVDDHLRSPDRRLLLPGFMGEKSTGIDFLCKAGSLEEELVVFYPMVMGAFTQLPPLQPQSPTPIPPPPKPPPSPRPPPKPSPSPQPPQQPAATRHRLRLHLGRGRGPPQQPQADVVLYDFADWIPAIAAKLGFKTVCYVVICATVMEIGMEK